MKSDKQIARDYARAKAAHANAQDRLRLTKAALVEMLIARRQNGESNNDIAAKFGLTARFVNQSLIRSTEYRTVLETKRKAKQAEQEASHAAWVAETALLIQKADAGADLNELAVEFGMTAHEIRQTIERCRWVFTERDFPMLAAQCLR